MSLQRPFQQLSPLKSLFSTFPKPTMHFIIVPGPLRRRQAVLLLLHRQAQPNWRTATVASGPFHRERHPGGTRGTHRPRTRRQRQPQTPETRQLPQAGPQLRQTRRRWIRSQALVRSG